MDKETKSTTNKQRIEKCVSNDASLMGCKGRKMVKQINDSGKSVKTALNDPAQNVS